MCGCRPRPVPVSARARGLAKVGRMSEMTAPAAPITDVVFDFCDVLLDW